MTTIDPARRILAQLRTQSLAWNRLTKASSQGAPRAPSEPSPDWLAHVARQIGALDRADPDRRRKAFAVYLRAALARELGIQRPDEPGFPDVVARVLQTMQDDPELARAMLAAGDALLQLSDD